MTAFPDGWADSLISPAVELLADTAYQDWPAADVQSLVRDAIAESLVTSAAASGGCAAVEYSGESLSGYLLIEPINNGGWADTWWTHPHAWAAASPESLRGMWARAASAAWEQGARDFYAVVPARSRLLPAWHSLSFGVQHVAAVLDQNARDAAATPQPSLSDQSGRDWVVFTPAESGDALSLAKLESLLPAALGESPVFSPVEPPALDESVDEWHQVLADESYLVSVARVDRDIVGFSLACDVEKSALHSGLMRIPGTATLAQVVVDRRWRGRGIGKALAACALRDVKAAGFAGLVTDWRSTNLAADAAWRSFGFTPTAYRLQRVVGSHG